MIIDNEWYADLARQAGYPDVQPIPPEAEWRGVDVRGLPGGERVYVARMIFNWRVLESDTGGWPTGRYWCYAGVGLPTFLVALRHAALYGDGEPDGWIKSHDGRTGDLTGHPSAVWRR